MTTEESEQDQERSRQESPDKYEVIKDGDSVDDCFVLEPEDDRAARAALKAYAATTDNDEVAQEIRERFGLEQSPQEKWEQHNESFNYVPPELPGDAWSSEQYQELYDRCIRREVNWFCTKCTGQGPIGSLEKARRHVEKKHGHDLVKKHETPREEQTAATDGGEDASTDKDRASLNHGLGDFSGEDDA